ncbi:MAG: DUF998 domain-containing protein [Bacteroidota bacterium]
MNRKTISLIGISGVSLFAITSVVGGLLLENYSFISQYISESFAIDTQYGIVLRTLGYIPSGILITLFCFLAYKKFPSSSLTRSGFYGLSVFYGIATIIIGIFPCDSDCNPNFIDPSVSQIIHNLVAILTYTLVPISTILIGLGLKQSPNYKGLSRKAIIYGIVSGAFVILLLSNPTSNYIGLIQRAIESLFIIRIITCAIELIRPIRSNSSPA